ncbi:ribosome small subunit-dependent GTPase A [Alkalibacillus salilacus]|uniref:Small ribosomal subunit biogenesis GTPase RsgA n=1 Tax=Alkalibacillus salilacus TaxID=284582 RepID=A0ABT9VE58_9BACI|nr:ribosome small subunit-dependent GTPase A [Alkalibacillus salilacus]MDQ0159140.1 ribosome biogenesis GTPase [Alkalibacillus salilacus]
MVQGKIMRALSGFYDVMVDDHVYRCKGRGLFRKQKITPLVGDDVDITLEEDGTGTIIDIEKRQHELVRPPIANVDQAIVVTSTVDPDFNPLLLDRFLVLIEHKQLDAVVVFTKDDLLTDEDRQTIEYYRQAYEQIGYPIVQTSNKPTKLTNQLKPYLSNKTSVIAGQSGVGKSTLLNQMDESLNIETNDISQSLGRGKHTTRHVELYSLGDGLVADTPGFSALDFDELSLGDLRHSFPEFLDYEDACKFRGCYHINEPKCAVKQAVSEGHIEEFRYQHYQQFFEEINQRKPRY